MPRAVRLFSASPRRASAPRTRMIRLRVSEEEYAALVEKGAAVGGMSKLLRDHLGQVAIRHREDERQRIIMLNRINAHLHMLAKWCNLYKQGAESMQVMEYLADVRREFARLVEVLR